MDQKLSLSTHILDTTKGQPAKDVKIHLFKMIENIWVQSVNIAVTDKDGRFKNFSKIDNVASGVYKLRFEVAEYFEKNDIETFYPFIEIPFKITSSDAHYHVPLLLNPFGYSTYRGS
jgi:5-hydroxyisourate hydrolase